MTYKQVAVFGAVALVVGHLAHAGYFQRTPEEAVYDCMQTVARDCETVRCNQVFREQCEFMYLKEE